MEPGDWLCGLILQWGGGKGCVPALIGRTVTEFLKALSEQAFWGQDLGLGEKVISLLKSCVLLILLAVQGVCRHERPDEPW